MKKIIFLALATIFCSVAFSQTLKDAIRLTENEQYDVAEMAYRQLIQKEPANGTNWYYLGENYRKNDDADSAKMCFEKGLETEPANVINQVGIGKSFLAKGDGGNAKIWFDKALAASGGKTVLLQAEVAEAYIHSKSKDLNYATTLLNNAIKVDAKNPELYILLGDVYTEKNDGTNAAINYNKALEIDKKSIKAIVRKGVLYKRSTNYDGAAEEFKNAIAIDPDFAPAHRELGETYFKMRKFEDAKAEYKRFLELSKDNVNARLRYASFLFLSEDYPSTLNELNQIQKFDSNYVPMVRLFGYTYFETGDYAKSLTLINKVFEKVAEDKRSYLDYKYYAKNLSKNGQDSLAVLNLDKAYSFDSTQTELLTEKASLLMKMKKYDEAAAAYQQRITYGKGLTSADYFNLGRAAYQLKDFNRADSAFAKVTEVQPSWPNGFQWRARSLVQIDSTSDLGLAKPHYEKYIELSIADSANSTKYKAGLIEAYKYLMSYSVIQEKDKKKGKEFIAKILELDPEDVQAKKSLDALNAPPQPPQTPQTPKQPKKDKP